ncbi:type 12 methyltransferase [Chitinispirillum alkaliphilum]|nr:type 12 methyltransferase [Chitinispirillum alkaliphilum]
MDLLFKTSEFQLEAPGNSEKTFRFLQPQNPNDVLSTISEDQYERDRFLPYWAELWPSSTVLFEYIDSLEVPADTRITELGCGLGHITAILASKVKKPVSMDISPIACKYALRNVLANGGCSAVICCDWRNLPLKPRSCDMIVASDILYEARWIEPVVSAIKSLLHPQGVAVIADPCRKPWNQFKNRIKSQGYDCSVIKTAKVNQEKTTIEIAQIRSEN